MGEKINHFDLPVCIKFRQKILEGQLCYQVDINQIKNQVEAKEAIKHGLLVMIDYNDDKMITEHLNGPARNELHETLSKEDNIIGAKIFIETLGKV